MKNSPTLSQTSTFLRAIPIQPLDQLVPCVNRCMQEVQTTEDEPPAIPDDFVHKSLQAKVKMTSSIVAKYIKSIFSGQKSDEDPLSRSIASIQFPPGAERSVNLPIIDPLCSIWSYIHRNIPQISFPRSDLQANDVLLSAFILSPRTPNVKQKPRVHIWALFLGSSPISSLTKILRCPLCEIGRRLNESHIIPAKFEAEGETIFDFKGAFDAPLSNVIRSLNAPCTLTSDSGCAHNVIFTMAVAVSVKDDSVFPIVIGGKGANPPKCYKCEQKPGNIFVGTKVSHGFFCSECSESVGEPGAVKFDLGRFFFAVPDFAWI